MNNVLIINLGNSQELVMCSHLVSSYKAENPQSQISLLTFKSNESIAKSISHISSVYTIDQDTISSIVENPLFSDAYAINQFTKDISPIASENWSTIINYSNNEVSSYLIRSFNSENIIGTYIDDMGVAKTTDAWSTYQNFVAAKSSRLPISIPTIRNHMAMTPIHNDVEKIKINPEYLFVSNQNFSRIRNMKGKSAKYIVGINLEVGHDGYALTEQTIEEIIETIEESEQFKVVLLTGGKTFQKEIVNRLNNKFNNELVSINVDSIALSAVLSNIDLMISTTNDQLAIADCLEIRLVEIRSHEMASQNPVASFDGNQVIFVKNETSLASDTLLCINEVFQTELPITFLNSENPTYLAITDEYGPYFTQTRGDINLQDEISYHIERMVHFEMLGYPKNSELINNIKAAIPKEDLHTFISSSRENITSVTKCLLATIKSLKEVNSSKGLERFISNLDSIIQQGNSTSIAAGIVRMFEGRIENISSTDAESNIKEIEKLLFDLKSDIQIFTNTLSDLISDVKEITDKDRNSASVEINN